MYCPRCGNKGMNFLPWLGTIYECTNCGYRGPLALGKIERLDRDATKTLKNEEKRKKSAKRAVS